MAIDRIKSIIPITNKLVFSPSFRRVFLEKRRISRLPRYEIGETNKLLKDHVIKYCDSKSCISAFKAIFEAGIYHFDTTSLNPLILDCGANIGLATVFWKTNYPNSKIIAFEADPKIFEVLQHNVKSFDDVELLRNAVWDEETTLQFHCDGADSGSAVTTGATTNTVDVPTVKLRPYLESQTVDLLKIDIEGAETRVLRDCRDALKNVKNIFVEYHSFPNEKQTIAELFSILTDAGFHVHVQPDFSSPQPFIQRNVTYGMDNRLNIYGVRL